jgi:alkyldihydroxyacetonephosphate synthase
MLRLSDPQETQTTLILSGKDRLVYWADRGLRLLRYGSERCLLIFAVTGDGEGVDKTIRETSAIARQHGGISGGGLVGNQWRMSRYRSPYLRNTLWEMGYAVDTLETAVPWVAVLETAAAIKAAIQQGLEDIGERVLVMAHLSHVYADGASIYVTFLFRR